MFKVVVSDCFFGGFGGGYEVINTEDEDFKSEIYTYAAEAQELADQLNEQDKDK